MQLPLTNVVNVSVSQTPAGIGQYNTSNLAIFSNEIPALSFGSLGYKIYLQPSDVAVDFGTSSKTYQMAVAVFSQQPNILLGGGYLVVIPMAVSIQTISFSPAPSSGAFKITYSGTESASIAWNASASTIQTTLQAIANLEEVIVTGSIASGLTIKMNGVYGPQSLLSVTSNTTGSTATVASTQAGVGLVDSINTSKDLVQYFGAMATATAEQIGQTDVLAVGALISTLNKLFFVVSNDSASVSPGGLLDLLRSGSLNKMRGLFYGDSVKLNAMLMMASYAGRALSTVFSGSNTTQTMHLKDLTGIQPDPTITQTILNLAQTAGADCYISLQGVSKVFTSGANKFFDQMYNLGWLVGALQVAGFNYLAQSSTKIPQTENGMDGLKGAYRSVCEQAVTCQYCAPGTWNSATTFGNQADFLLNISQRGYYIYSTPIAQQLQADRVARKAPLIQIAIKEAGAIQSSTVVVNINA